MTRLFLRPVLFGTTALALGLTSVCMSLPSARAAEAVAPPVMYPAGLWQGRGEAVIRVLNRTDSHVETMTVPVGGQGQYRSLHLGVTRCVERPETLPRDAAALITTSDDTDPGAHFQGWILAEEPSLTAYKSALYDIAIVSCSGPKADPALAPLPQPVVPVISSATPDGADNQPGDLDDPSRAPASLPGRADGQNLPGSPSSGAIPSGNTGGPTRLAPLGEASSLPRPQTPEPRQPASSAPGSASSSRNNAGDTGGPMQLAPLSGGGSGGNAGQDLPPPQPYNH